jgi:hypothetical protein
MFSSEETNSTMSLTSSTGLRVVRKPQSSDLFELRKMKGGCAALTGHEVVIYGGILGLIFSVREYQNNFPPE